MYERLELVQTMPAEENKHKKDSKNRRNLSSEYIVSSWCISTSTAVK